MGPFRRRMRMLALGLCATLAFAGAALAEQSGDFSYDRLDGGARITGYTGFSTEVDVPDQLDGLPVTALGAGAFAGSEALERVALPDGLREIADGAFADCYSLSEVSLPSTVARVGENPFADCENLRKLELRGTQGYLELINGVLFGDGGQRLIYCPRMLPMERYVAPEGTRRIDARAFSYCNRLLSVTLPDSVAEIGPDAFERRANLTLVVGRGSAAEAYAAANDIKFAYPDAAEWLADRTN